MFKLSCHITIGNYVFDHVVKVVIRSSYNELTDTAEIVLPRRYNINGKINDTVKLSSVFAVGDPVQIKLGYDDNNNTEFIGYISEILPQEPFTIKCEDGMYLLKRSKPASRSWTETTLAEVLRYLAPDAVIDVPGITLKPFYINKANTAKVLETLKEQYGLVAYFRDGVLYVGLPFQDRTVMNDTVIYHLQKNVIQANLVYRTLDSVKLKVNAIGIMPDNSKIEISVGDQDGELRTLHFYNLSRSELQQQANAKLDELKYEGFQGSFTAFGIPLVKHGQVVDITDDEYSEKNGRHFVEEVVTEFGEGGFRRMVKPGRRAG